MNPIFVKVRYHQEDDKTYCGPAVAQMLLHALDPGNGLPLDQGTLFGLIQRYNDPPGAKYSTIVGLVGALNEPRPGNSANRFVRFTECCPISALGRIVGILKNAMVAVPVLVDNDNSHWVLVNGVSFEGTGTPQDRALRGLYYHNPGPSVPTSVSHTDADLCGRGGSHATGPTYATIYGWNKDYWTSVNVYEGVGVDSVLTGEAVRVALPGAGASIGQDEACAAATAAVAAEGFSGSDPLWAFLSGATARSASPPIERSGDPTNRYYNVTMVQGLWPSAQVSVDESNGALCSVAGPPGNPAISYDDIVAVMERSRTELRDFFGPTWAEPSTVENAAKNAVLVWYPSHRMPSPFYPGVKVSVGDRSAVFDPGGRLFALQLR